MQQKTDAPRRIEARAARHPRRSPRRVTDWSGLILAAPTVLLVAAFTLYPFANALYTSTQLSSPIIEGKFVGLQNYYDVVTSPYFLDATKTTSLFTAVTVPVLVVLGVLVAVLLHQPFFCNTFFRAGVFLDDSGALNVSLYSLGVIQDYIPWLTTPELARMAVVIVFIWTQLPLVG